MTHRLLLLLVLAFPFGLIAQQSTLKSGDGSEAYHPPVSGPKLYQAY